MTAGTRPRDWQPLADHDPVPGDPDRLEQLGRKLRRTADELDRQVRHLKAAAELDSWDSGAGKEFREKAKKCRGRLEAAHKRYETVADAIGDRVVDHGPDYESNAAARPGGYATELHRAQRIAEIARQDAQQAEADRSAARKGLEALSGKSEEGEGKRHEAKLEGKAQAAAKSLGMARDKLRKAQGIRDAAARKAREAIDDVISDDALKDSFRDGFADFVEWAAGWTEAISKWAGIAALAVGWIPVIGQGLAGLLGGISMVATLINIACTAVQVAMGDESWTALATAAVGLLMMGAGKAMSKVSGRYAKGLLERMRRAKGGRQTARQGKRNRQKFNREAAVVSQGSRRATSQGRSGSRSPKSSRLPLGRTPSRGATVNRLRH